MFIHEAIKKCCVDHKGEPAIEARRCIARKKWPSRMTAGRGATRIFPTNSPDGCIFYSFTRDEPSAGWQPTMEDLLADDWIVLDPFGRREIK